MIRVTCDLSGATDTVEGITAALVRAAELIEEARRLSLGTAVNLTATFHDDEDGAILAERVPERHVLDAMRWRETTLTSLVEAARDDDEEFAAWRRRVLEDPVQTIVIHRLEDAWASGYEQALRDYDLVMPLSEESHDERRQRAAHAMFGAPVRGLDEYVATLTGLWRLQGEGKR